MVVYVALTTRAFTFHDDLGLRAHMPPHIISHCDYRLEYQKECLAHMCVTIVYECKVVLIVL